MRSRPVVSFRRGIVFMCFLGMFWTVLGTAPVRALEIPLDGVVVRPVYHGTVWMTVQTGEPPLQIVIDPWSRAPLPEGLRADLILITDVHYDHMDVRALRTLLKSSTEIVAPPAVSQEIQPQLRKIRIHVLHNGESLRWKILQIRAIPMYNTDPARKQYHPKGRGNGYILTVRNKRIYIAGDTQCTPEMRKLRGIDLALVPINLPYTMDADEAAECVRAFRPRIVVPYHYQVGEADPARFQELLRNSGIRVIVE